MKITNLEHLENISQQSKEVDSVTGGIFFNSFGYAQAYAQGPTYYPQVAATAVAVTSVTNSRRP